MTVEGKEGLRRRLEQQLGEIGIPFEVDADGDFKVSFENSITFIRPLDWKGRTTVRIWAITNVELELSDELTRYLMTENTQVPFGGFQVQSGQVAFSHTLLGEFLQRAELELALSVVAGVAARYNDEIKSRFGGKLFGET